MNVTLCPVPGCERLQPPNKMLCLTCWRRVSKPTQNLVYAAWKRYSRAHGDDFPAARAAYYEVREQAIRESEA
jgi:hypothetical protein